MTVFCHSVPLCFCGVRWGVYQCLQTTLNIHMFFISELLQEAHISFDSPPFDHKSLFYVGIRDPR